MYLKIYVNKATKRFEGFGGAELRGAGREGPAKSRGSYVLARMYMCTYKIAYISHHLVPVRQYII